MPQWKNSFEHVTRLYLIGLRFGEIIPAVSAQKHHSGAGYDGVDFACVIF